MPGTLNTQFFSWMEMVISNHFQPFSNQLVHHPIETTIYNWLFGVPGVSVTTHSRWCAFGEFFYRAGHTHAISGNSTAPIQARYVFFYILKDLFFFWNVSFSLVKTKKSKKINLLNKQTVLAQRLKDVWYIYIYMVRFVQGFAVFFSQNCLIYPAKLGDFVNVARSPNVASCWVTSYTFGCCTLRTLYVY